MDTPRVDNGIKMCQTEVDQSIITINKDYPDEEYTKIQQD